MGEKNGDNGVLATEGRWRKGISFSQESGPFVVAWVIGFILTAKGRGIDREAAAPPDTSFLSGIRDRG